MIQLTADQREEIRRLTQRANRRIISAQKTYAKAGRTVIPAEIAGKFQTIKQWEAHDRPISRSVKFETQAEYKRQLAFLKSFDDRPGARPTMREYTNVQRQKVAQALETSMGRVPSKKLFKRLRKMTAPELGEFWDSFSEKAARKGLQYASDSVMQESVEEFFNEDIEDLLEG